MQLDLNLRMLKSRALVLASLAIMVFGASAEAKTYRHVIVISIDGLGKDLYERSPVHQLRKLAREGDIARRARTVDPPLTVPSHISMFSGVDALEHQGVHNQMDANLERVRKPTVFDLAQKNGLSSAAVVGKEKLRHVFETSGLTRIHQPSWFLVGEFAGRFPSLIEHRAMEEIRKSKPNLLFVHYALPDTMGHWFRWNTWPQKAAVRMIDQSVYRIVKQAKKTYGSESVAIIVTADHGGHGGSHGRTLPDGRYASEETDLFVPWIIVGGKIRNDVDTVHIYDTAPTVAALLGLDVPDEWAWQGQSVIE